MIGITIYGREGEGVSTACKVLVQAFEDQGIKAKGFVKRSTGITGNNVKAFIRASRKEISSKAPISISDYSLATSHDLVDSMNIVSLTKPKGVIIVNSSKSVENISNAHKVISVDIEQVASNTPRSSNMGLLGAFVGATRVLQIKSVSSAISKILKESTQNNQRVAEKVYETVRRELI